MADIRSWRELVEWEEEFSLTSSGEWVFRGQAFHDDYAISSTLERAFVQFGVKESRDQVKIERSILNDFMRSYHVYAPATVPGDDDIMAWFALMRHYGAPTRLVDVTYSLFIATYFAIESWKAEDKDKGKEPPVVWAINRSWLSEYLHKNVFEKVPNRARPRPTSTGEQLRRSWYKPYDHDVFHRLFMRRHKDDVDFGPATSPARDFVTILSTFKTNERILVQQGLFLAATDVTKPFQTVLDKMVAEKLTGYVAEQKIKEIKIVDGVQKICRDSTAPG
jgi:hypothetical protein